MPEIVLIPSQAECIDIAEANLHLRLTENSQSPLVLSFLSSAREVAESDMRRQLMHCRRRLYQDKFPMAGSGTPLPMDRQVNIPGYAMMLPRGPVLDVMQIGYVDMNGTPQICDPSVYRLNNILEPGIVSLQFGQIWPIPLPEVSSVWVDYDCGSASSFVPVDGSPEAALKVQGPVSFGVGQMVAVYNSGGSLPGAELAAMTPYLIASADVTTTNVLDPDSLLQSRLAVYQQQQNLEPTPATIPYYSGIYTLTDMQGDPVTIGASNGGTNYIGAAAGGNTFLRLVPDGVRSWVKIRMGALYENREEVAIMSRGQLRELQFVDGLLDPYRMGLP